MQYYLDYLETRVTIERKRLEKLVKQFGFLHPSVLAQSQRLDRAIVEIQKRRLSSIRTLENAV